MSRFALASFLRDAVPLRPFSKPMVLPPLATPDLRRLPLVAAAAAIVFVAAVCLPTCPMRCFARTDGFFLMAPFTDVAFRPRRSPPPLPFFASFCAFFALLARDVIGPEVSSPSAAAAVSASERVSIVFSRCCRIACQPQQFSTQ